MTGFLQRCFVGMMVACVSLVVSNGHAQVLFGNYTDDAGSSVHSADFLLGQQIEVTEDFNLTNVGLIVDGNANGSAMANIGIYSDAAGQPGTLLVETGLFNLGLGDQHVPVTSATILTAGDYWYMAVYDHNVNISQDGGVSESTYYQTQSAGAALPSPLTSLANYSGPEFNYYLYGVDLSSETLYGNVTDDAGSSVHSSDFLLGQQISVTDDVTLTDVGLIVDGNNNGDAMANIGIYSDSGGQPGVLVAETGLFSLALGDQRAPVTSPTVLPAGDYWYMAVYDSTVNISQDNGAGVSTLYQSHSAGTALPSPLTSLSSYGGPEFNYYLVANAVVTPGDANGDGKVDGLDYLVWANNFGDDPADDPPGSPENGDFDDNGKVDGLDYLVWASNFGMGPNDSVAVPEPAACSTTLLGIVGLLAVARRRC